MNIIFLIAIFVVTFYFFDIILLAVKAKGSWTASLLFAGACTVIAAKYLL